MITEITESIAPVAPVLPPPNVEPLRFRIDDELSVRTRTILKQRVVDALAGDALNGVAPRRCIVLDASDCGYVDSSGLGVLVSLSKKCQAAGGSLTLERLNPELRIWLAFVNLDTVLTVDPPITAAERQGL